MNQRILTFCLLLQLLATTMLFAQSRPPAKLSSQVSLLVNNRPYLMAQLGHSGSINSVAFSLDGRFILTGSSDKTARLWETATGREVRRYQGHSGSINSVAFSPDGRYVLTGSEDKTTRLWQIATNKEVRCFQGHTLWVSCVAFSPDGRYVLTGSWDNIALLWETTTGKEVKRFEGHFGSINSVAFSPDGRFVLTGSKDGTARLWETATGKEIRRFQGQSGAVYSAVFSPDSKHVLTGSEDGTACLCEAATGKEIRRFQADHHFARSVAFSFAVVSVAFSRDGKHVLTGSWRATCLWEAATGKEIRRFQGDSDLVSSVAFSPDNRYILAGSREKTSRLWETASGKEVRRFEGHSDAVRIVITASNGKYVLTGGEGKTAQLWETTTGKEIRRFKGHSDWFNSVAFSPDGRLVLTGSEDGTARLWETATGKEIRHFKGYIANICPGAFSPDGRFILTGGDGETACLWETATGKEVRRFVGHFGSINSVAFSPDGRLVLTGSEDGTARLWETATGKEIRRYQVDHYAARSVAFAHDGKFLLTGGDSVMACLWETATGKEIRRFQGVESLSVAFSPDGKLVLTGSGDGIARLWEIATGKEIRRLQGHSDFVYSAVFSLDDKHVLTSSKDGTTRLWEIATGKELCTLISFKDGSWAVADNEGRYDASNPDGIEGLYWVVGNQPIALRQLKERYYEPNLLAKIMAGQRLRNVQAFDNVKLYPDVVTDPLKGTRLTIHLTEKGGGFGKVQVYVNDALYREVMPPAGPDAATRTVTLDIADAPTLRPGKANTVRVVAYNAEGWLPSRGVEMVSQPRGAAIKERRLFAIVCGISDYAAPNLHLSFSAKDAADFAAALGRGARNFFGADKTFVTLLASSGPPGTLPVTKDNLRQAFDSVRKQANPEDVLVIYLAGHGVALPIENSLYCYLTQDANSADTARLASDASLRERTTVTSSELAQWIGAIKASYRVMALDTCAAGAAEKTLALADKRAPDGDAIRAMELFKGRTGFHVLMGCAEDRASYEASRYRQGVLTYALLQGMKGAALENDAFVNVQKLFNYAVEEVPRLAGSVGGVQNPLYRAPNAGGVVIGQLTPDDRKTIALSDALPQLLRPKLSNRESGDDDLDLEKLLRQRLRDACDVVPRGENAPPPMNAVYLDADDLPGAIRPAGQYEERADGTVVVTLTLRRDKQPLAPPVTITGRKNDPADLTAKIAAAIASGVMGK